jgi:hypothetical protein
VAVAAIQQVIGGHAANGLVVAGDARALETLGVGGEVHDRHAAPEDGGDGGVAEVIGDEDALQRGEAGEGFVFGVREHANVPARASGVSRHGLVDGRVVAVPEEQEDVGQEHGLGVGCGTG